MPILALKIDVIVQVIMGPYHSSSNNGCQFCLLRKCIYDFEKMLVFLYWVVNEFHSIYQKTNSVGKVYSLKLTFYLIYNQHMPKKIFSKPVFRRRPSMLRKSINLLIFLFKLICINLF